MYLSYYNLKVKPFQMSTDPEFLWLGEKHKEALAVLKYAILENKGVLALTGDVGTGKTTLINALLKSLGNDTITATIYDARLDILDFFRTVAAAFKIKGAFDGKGKFILKFMDFLIKAHERNQKVLLIIDEAQGINKDLLEEIRLLSNLEAEYTRLLNIFFVGQNEFIDILQKYENRALRQRVTIRYHIDPLTLNETAAYIQHRLEVSGTTAPIFNSGAIDEIYFFSGGYPRLINIMCDHALLSGFVREVQTINAKLIRECREELLVSKKSSREDFEVPAGNQQAPYGAPMASGPLKEPTAPAPSREPIAPASSREPKAAPAPSREPKAPAPSRESMTSDLSKAVMDYVKDSRFEEDEQDGFGPRYSTFKLAGYRKNRKKRFLFFFSILIFLLIGVAGYFVNGKSHNNTASFVAAARKPFNNYFSMNEKSKNDHPSAAQTGSDVSDISRKVQSEKAEDSRFPANDSLNSGTSKTAVPAETEAIHTGPPKTFSRDADAASFSKKSEESETESKPPALYTDQTGSLSAIPKVPLDTKSPKESEEKTIHGSGAVRSHSSPKTNAAALTTKKPQQKIQSPVDIPASTVKRKNVRTAASEPAQIHTASENTKPAEKQVLDKVREKSESVASRTPSVRELEKAKEPETPVSGAPKKELKVASSVPSDKQTTTLFEKFKENLSKKTVDSEAVKPLKPPTMIEEKTPAAFSVADQKNPINQKASNQADQGTGREIASLGARTNQSEKAGKTDLPYIPLMTRLETFLKEYCRTYEQKDLDRFSTYFAFNAVERGKPFTSWLTTYRRNFERIDSIEYNIALNRYATQEDTGLVKIDGTFHIRAKLENSSKWLKNSGEISMILEANGNSFKVKELDY
jgi:type II secretory pathway predicted ATPase ExeA